MAITTVNRARAIYGIMVKRASGSTVLSPAESFDTLRVGDSVRSNIPQGHGAFSSFWNWLFPNNKGNQLAYTQRIAGQPAPARRDFPKGTSGYNAWLKAMQEQRSNINAAAANGAQGKINLYDFTSKKKPIRKK